jgi:D-xylose transport system substrate-binding protein
VRVQHPIQRLGSHRARRSGISLLAVAALAAAACGSTTSGSSGGSLSNPGVPSGLSVSSFNVDIASVMGQLKTLTAYATQNTSGLLIGVILPDTTSSVRWQDFDQPYLNDAFADAGFTQSQYRIDNAQGSDQTQLDDATADISLGAKVLVVTPLDGPTGQAIAQLAEAKGVKVIDYDRAIFQGSTYYVSFDGVKVGQLQATGLEQCVASEKIASPVQLYIQDGGRDTDPNAVAFASGYDGTLFNQKPTGTNVIAPGTTATVGGVTYNVVLDNYAPGWNNTDAGTEFQQAFTAHPNIDAALIANDGMASAIITDLIKDGVKPGTFPTTGQDATAQGMAYILEGYQCGSVYKAVYLEAEDAVTAADILLSGNTIPPALLNGSTSGTGASGATITDKASLLTPVWVTQSNMESTVVKDGFDTASAICALVTPASLCTTDGIS